MRCCVWFAEATERGTDNEMYGPAVFFVDGKPHVGSIPEPIHFCPWCGAKFLPSEGRKP